MDLNAYHHAINLGFTDREATKIGEDAFEDALYSIGRHRHVKKNTAPICDICGEYLSVTGANGYSVCSEECCNIAMNKNQKL